MDRQGRLEKENKTLGTENIDTLDKNKIKIWLHYANNYYYLFGIIWEHQALKMVHILLKRFYWNQNNNYVFA